MSSKFDYKNKVKLNPQHKVGGKIIKKHKKPHHKPPKKKGCCG